ncbi:MAG: helix-turn-helix domain-containing protein [Oscillatoria sp. PMC 1051.18]|nr:helix-turn-helix domain-containing protein [Oscillatoria sp. PMC 1050.18]MEC5028374.1 helix-turn-helix domain-containing protein [Oscillatoria sp. PMC 1051.18]
MILNYTYRIYPDSQQTQLLQKWWETLRVSYNYALREIKDGIASRKCPIDAGFAQFRSILKFVGKKRGLFVGEVDHKGTSPTCPNCPIAAKKELCERLHSYSECQARVDRDVAAAQEICNRGRETYPGTLEKQEIGSQRRGVGGYVPR